MKEKTGWTYILITAQMASILKPNQRKAFRVKGTLEQFEINQVAILPLGTSDFILVINAKMRQGIAKKIGDFVDVKLQIDESPIKTSEDLLDCLALEPDALAYFNTLVLSHKKYFSDWIEQAKTIETKTKRISQSIWALSNCLGYSAMIRHFKTERDNNF